MATNKYFNHTQQKNEQDSFEALVIESIQMNGIDVTYLPRENVAIDEILQEPTQSKFTKYFVIEALMPDGGNMDGQQDILSKFGYTIDQNTELMLSKKRWDELGTGLLRPREGDVIYIGNIDDKDSYHGSFVNTFFEIKQVWYNNPDWQFGKHFVYKLTLKTLRNSHEKYETGNPVLDVLNKESENDAINTGINEASKTNAQQIVVDKNNPFGDF